MTAQHSVCEHGQSKTCCIQKMHPPASNRVSVPCQLQHSVPSLMSLVLAGIQDVPPIEYENCALQLRCCTLFGVHCTTHVFVCQNVVAGHTESPRLLTWLRLIILQTDRHRGNRAG